MITVVFVFLRNDIRMLTGFLLTWHSANMDEIFTTLYRMNIMICNINKHEVDLKDKHMTESRLRIAHFISHTVLYVIA